MCWKIGEFSPSEHVVATLQQGETGRPGVVEGMEASAGLEFLERARVEVTNEWQDVATAASALAASGPAVPAIENIGYEAFVAELVEVFGALDDPHVGVRITSEFGWATARRPPG